MKKILIVIVGMLLSISMSSMPVLANTENDDNDGYTTEIYVDENYGNQTNEGIQPRTRGNCTDVYSRAWCNAHGYQNNRPVPGSVKLIQSEINCYLKWSAIGVAKGVTSLVTGNVVSGLWSTASTVFKLFNCIA